tara:strand:- start:78 stop:350 length:273 start_codon:yes stop_codon:yes gene_type:complete
MEVIMPEEVKFTDEEMNKVKTFQQNYVNIQNQFGQLKMAQLRLDKQEIDLENTLESTQKEEQKFLDEITEKYGEGSLNQETGVFTPNKSE